MQADTLNENDPLVHKNNQLNFDTHDLALISPKTMRKNQTYLTESTANKNNSLDSF